MSGRAPHGRVPHRGGVLLEVVVALAIFVGASLAIMASIDRAAGGLQHTRGLQRAADLARTAMAQLEAGLASPLTLNGPVPTAEFGADAAVPYSAGLPGESGWELEVTTEPSEFPGLTRVAITAKRHRPGAPAAVEYAFTLRQLVRLNERAALGEGPAPAVLSRSAP